MVRGRTDQRCVQLRRPARRGRPGRQGRLPLGGRAGRHPHDHVRGAAAGGLPGHQRADRARRAQGRPGRALPADDPGDGDRDAGLRPARRAAHGGLRRLLRRRAAQPDARLRRQAGDHRRRRLPARCRRPAQAGRRRGADRDPGRRERPGRPPDRAGHAVDRRPRPLVARARRRAVRPAHRRAARRRAPAVRHVHVGHDGQAEGHPAHHRRLPDRRGVHAQRGVRPQAGDGRLLDRGRHRLGHRPLVHRLRPARQRRDQRDVRGHPGHPAQGPLVGDRRRSTA